MRFDFTERDVAQELAQTLERVVLALDRDEHVVGGREAVDGQQAERRRAVDQGEVVVVASALRAPGASLSSRENAGTSSISAPARSMVAGHDEEVPDARRLDAVVDRGVVHDDVVDRALDVAVADARARSSRCPGDRGRRPAPGSPISASAAPRLTAVVVLPTPPFWLAIEMTRGKVIEASSSSMAAVASVADPTAPGSTVGAGAASPFGPGLDSDSSDPATNSSVPPAGPASARGRFRLPREFDGEFDRRFRLPRCGLDRRLRKPGFRR